MIENVRLFLLLLAELIPLFILAIYLAALAGHSLKTDVLQRMLRSPGGGLTAG